MCCEGRGCGPASQQTAGVDHWQRAAGHGVRHSFRQTGLAAGANRETGNGQRATEGDCYEPFLHLCTNPSLPVLLAQTLTTQVCGSEHRDRIDRDPVPPIIGSGATVNMNSHRFRAAAASASSSRSRLSRRCTPRYTEREVVHGQGPESAPEGAASCGHSPPSMATSRCLNQGIMDASSPAT